MHGKAQLARPPMNRRLVSAMSRSLGIVSKLLLQVKLDPIASRDG
jgi:hypothetical protein